MSAFAILTDLIEDPKGNGDYRLNLQGDDLKRLWSAVTEEHDELRRLRAIVASHEMKEDK